MLLPIMSRADRHRVLAARQHEAEEGGRDLLVRAKARSTRWRL
jgi:hypothetical protein